MGKLDFTLQSDPIDNREIGAYSSAVPRIRTGVHSPRMYCHSVPNNRVEIKRATVEGIGPAKLNSTFVAEAGGDDPAIRMCGGLL